MLKQGDRCRMRLGNGEWATGFYVDIEGHSGCISFDSQYAHHGWRVDAMFGNSHPIRDRFPTATAYYTNRLEPLFEDPFILSIREYTNRELR